MTSTEDTPAGPLPNTRPSLVPKGDRHANTRQYRLTFPTWGFPTSILVLRSTMCAPHPLCGYVEQQVTHSAATLDVTECTGHS